MAKRLFAVRVHKRLFKRPYVVLTQIHQSSGITESSEFVLRDNDIIELEYTSPVPKVIREREQA